jgi:hypothetical protein
MATPSSPLSWATSSTCDKHCAFTKKKPLPLSTEPQGKGSCRFLSIPGLQCVCMVPSASAMLANRAPADRQRFTPGLPNTTCAGVETHAIPSTSLDLGQMRRMRRHSRRPKLSSYEALRYLKNVSKRVRPRRQTCEDDWQSETQCDV